METRKERLIRLRGDRTHEAIAKSLTAKLRRTVGKGTVWKWEQTQSPNIELDIFFALADVYEVDPRELAIGEKANADGIPSYLRALHDDYTAVDEDVRNQVRNLLRTLAEKAAAKEAPRKVRDRPKAKRMTSLERDE